MRARILKELRTATAPVSGSRLAEELDISRSALWKHIEKLRGSGYEIIGSTRIGYRLVSSPDIINMEELAAALPPAFREQAVRMEETGSTNDAAKELAARGRFKPAGLVVAETQGAGRGRLGRRWQSPRGGIWMSLVVRPDIAVADAGGMPLLASVVTAEALEAQVKVEARIKWPNDILIRGKKVAGILTELAAEWGHVDYLVVGLGLNANFPAGALSGAGLNATTLLDETGKTINRTALIAEIVTRLWDALPALGGDFESVLGRWRRLSATLGRRVTVTAGGEQVLGTAVDLDPQGGLIVLTDSDEHRVFRAGEVTLRV